MTKNKTRTYTILTPAQRMVLCQIITTFPNAKATEIARMAGVSSATVYNVTRPILEAANFFKG